MTPTAPIHKTATVLLGLLTLVACGPKDETRQISVEGTGLFFRMSGAVKLIDRSNGLAIYGFLASPALDELKSGELFEGIPDDCLVVAYRLKAEGQLTNEQSILASKLTLVGQYNRQKLDEEVRRIGIEALNDDKVCPSA
jgi:hypothetical protein